MLIFELQTVGFWALRNTRSIAEIETLYVNIYLDGSRNCNRIFGLCCSGLTINLSLFFIEKLTANHRSHDLNILDTLGGYFCRILS